MKKKNDKIYIIILIIIFVVLVPICIVFAGKENDNHDENKKHNLELLKEFIDYETIENCSVDSSAALNKAESFVLVRNTKDGWILERSYKGKEFYKKWSKEDLEKYDLIVFAISGYTGKQYEDGAGNTKFLSSESVTLYYYNNKANSVFETEFIEGEELKETEQYNHEISSNMLFDKIKERFVK